MRVYYFLLCLAFTPILSAQTFQATPAPMLQQELAPGQANECYIYFENHSSDSLQLKWKKVETSFPAEWVIDLCDFGLCYVGIPASGLMNPAAPNEQPYLKLIVQPGTTAGAGWLWFRVWENGNPDNFEDVYFSVYTPGVSSIESPQALDIQAFPNPVSEYLTIQNHAEAAMPAQLISATGQVVWSGRLQAGTTSTISVANFPPGNYFFKTTRKTHVILRAP